MKEFKNEESQIVRPKKGRKLTRKEVSVLGNYLGKTDGGYFSLGPKKDWGRSTLFYLVRESKLD